VHNGTETVDVTYTVGGSERTRTLSVYDTSDYTEGRRYPVAYDPARPYHVLLLDEHYDTTPLVLGWLPAVAAAAALAVMGRRERRAQALERRGPWSRLDLWYAPGGDALVGDRAAGYVRAEVTGLGGGVPWRRRPRPQAGRIVVAGNPEPGEHVAIVDAAGTTVPLTRRLWAPTVESVAPLVDDPIRTDSPYVIRSLLLTACLAVVGALALLVIDGAAYAIWTGADLVVVPAGVGLGAWFLARIRVAVDRDGIAICNGLGTRRLRWAEIATIRDGQHRPFVSLPGLSYLEIFVGGDVRPVRPPATYRGSARALQLLLAGIRPYAPAGLAQALRR
jgi:hypothetical protein